jgi:hypothetical protein
MRPADVRSDVGRRRRGSPLTRLAAGRPKEDRLSAIADVRRAPTPDLVSALVTVAETADEDPVVRAAAIAALAAEGRTFQLEQNPPPAVWSAARKAAGISARQNMVAAAERGDRTLQLPRASRLRMGRVALAVEPIALPKPEATRVAAASSLPPSALGPVQGLRCQGNEFAVILRADLDPTRLEAAPARPAQIAVHHTDEEDVWTVPYDVLTAPEGSGRLRITVVDERGEPRFVGTARVRGGELLFDVGVVRRTGAAAATVRGRVGDGLIAIEEGRAATRAVRARQPSRTQGRG